jgi:hypothetical protein
MATSASGERLVRKGDRADQNDLHGHLEENECSSFLLKPNLLAFFMRNS